MKPNDPVLLDVPASLETRRLLLRAPKPGDGALLFEAISESLIELREFLVSLPWVAGEQSAEASEAFARKGQANFLARKDFPLVMFDKASGLLVGATGLHRPVWTTPKVEIGYWVRTSARGRGYVTEAVAAVHDFAVNQIGAVRTEIVTDEANHRSRAVAERCGFQLEAVLKHERRAPDGSLRNTCIYAKLKNAP
jgi:RimJ/RimL family protein N-acetyltransferase